jgi:hypothetical protein
VIRVEQMSKAEFWLLWMKFLSKEVYFSHGTEQSSDIQNSIVQKRRSSLSGESSKDVVLENLSLFERLHARYAPSRRLKHLYFESHVLVKALINTHSSTIILVYVDLV